MTPLKATAANELEPTLQQSYELCKHNVAELDCELKAAYKEIDRLHQRLEDVYEFWYKQDSMPLSKAIQILIQDAKRWQALPTALKEELSQV